MVNEIVDFLKNNEQSVEVNPTDCCVDGATCLVIRDKRVLIVICLLEGSCIGLSIKNSSDLKTIRLWEDAWRVSRNIVESRLLSAIGKSIRLPARVTICKRIDKPTADAFLNKHHLQGSPKAKFKYGLFLPKSYYRLIENKRLIDEESEETLVAVATFAAPKTYYRGDNQSRSIELIRFTNHSAFTIIGGLNKLLKFLEKEQQPDDIMTYLDADWSDGKAFEKLGFERIEKIPEIEFYINKATFVRQRNLSETNQDGFVKVCNSGSWKFIKYIKKNNNE